MLIQGIGLFTFHVLGEASSGIDTLLVFLDTTILKLVIFFLSSDCGRLPLLNSFLCLVVAG